MAAAALLAARLITPPYGQAREDQPDYQEWLHHLAQDGTNAENKGNRQVVVAQDLGL